MTAFTNNESLTFRFSPLQHFTLETAVSSRGRRRFRTVAVDRLDVLEDAILLSSCWLA